MNLVFKKNITFIDQESQISCIRCSPDGKELASGDLAGNIRVFNLKTYDQSYYLPVYLMNINDRLMIMKYYA